MHCPGCQVDYTDVYEDPEWTQKTSSPTKFTTARSFKREFRCTVVLCLSVALCAVGPVLPSSASISFMFVSITSGYSHPSCKAVELELCFVWPLPSDLSDLGDLARSCCSHLHSSLGHKLSHQSRAAAQERNEMKRQTD